MKTLFLTAILILVTVSLNAGDDKKAQPRPRIEDAIRRAVIKAKTLESMKFKRASVINQEVDDDYAYIVVCEFGTNDIGIFQGSDDPTKDQWILIDNKDAKLLIECAGRSYR